MIKAIFFDLDNTLYDETIYYQLVLKKFCLETNFNLDELWYAFLEIYPNSKDIFADILKKVDFYSREKQEKLFNIYNTIECSISLTENSKKVIEYAKKENLILTIITNGVIDVQKNKIKSLGIENKFDLIVYARMFGKNFEKPHVKTFLYCMNTFNLKPQDILFVGDNPETDIIGALNCGFKAVLFKNKYYQLMSEIKPTYLINSLSELLNLLQCLKKS